MKKIFISLFFFLFVFNCYSYDFKGEVSVGGFYNYTSIFAGSASYQKYIDYDYYNITDVYRATFPAAGGFVGYDLYIGSNPIGIYMRLGLIDVFNVNRTAAGQFVSLKNTNALFNTFVDFGGIYNYKINNIYSLNIAGAASILFVNSEYISGDFSRASIDSLYGVGVTFDLCNKITINYFILNIGLSSSFYPLALTTSSDSNIDYRQPRGTLAYNLRPYIAVGVSLF